MRRGSFALNAEFFSKEIILQKASWLFLLSSLKYFHTADISAAGLLMLSYLCNSILLQIV